MFPNSADFEMQNAHSAYANYKPQRAYACGIYSLKSGECATKGSHGPKLTLLDAPGYTLIPQDTQNESLPAYKKF